MSIAAKPTATVIPVQTTSGARALADGTSLFIDAAGSWKVGKFGEGPGAYKTVSFGTTTTINDLTYDVTALAAGRGNNGGFKIYASANANERVMFEVDVTAEGVATGARRMTNAEIHVAETRLGLDLNGSGALGNANALVNDSTENLMADANGDLYIQGSNGRVVALTLDGALLNIREIGDLEFADVSFEDDGSIAAYLYSEDGDLYFQAFDAAGRAVGDLELISDFNASTQSAGLDRGILRVGSASGRAQTLNAQGQSAEAKTGKDLNRQSDTPLTEGWTDMLKTPEIKSLIQKGTAAGAKLDHAGVVSLLNTVVGLTGETGKVSQTVIDDLRAIAARGKALFTAKDTQGKETSYLAYVFDKAVNDSDANAFFTGGGTTKQNLGNLSTESTGKQLGLLRDKWLLGKDLPNPNVEGDSANASAKAGGGEYAKSAAPLFTDGLQFLDVIQGNAGTCYLMASLAGLAKTNAAELQAIFVANAPDTSADRTFGVRFFDQQGGVHWVTANDMFVHSDGKIRYSKDTGSDASGAAKPELWAALVEKAWAQANELKIIKRETAGQNVMAAVEGGFAEASIHLINHNVVSFVGENEGAGPFNGNTRMTLESVSGKTPLQAFAELMNKGNLIFIGLSNQAQSIKDDSGSLLFQNGHAHMAFDADPADPNNTTVISFNPWGRPGVAGVGEGHQTPFTYDLAKLVGLQGVFLFADIPMPPVGG